MIEGFEEWMAEWRNNGDEGRVGIMLGRSVVRMKEQVLVGVNRVAMGMCPSCGRGGNT